MSEQRDQWISAFVDVLYAAGATEKDATDAAEESYRLDPLCDPIEAGLLEMSYWEADTVDVPNQAALEARGQTRMEGL